MYILILDHQPYIPGTMPVEPGPLSRFTPPLEEGTISRWLPLHAPVGSWVLDPFGFSPRLVLEAARAGYRVLVMVNNPITRFLLEMSADPPNEADFRPRWPSWRLPKKGMKDLAPTCNRSITLHAKNADSRSRQSRSYGAKVKACRTRAYIPVHTAEIPANAW